MAHLLKYKVINQAFLRNNRKEIQKISGDWATTGKTPDRERHVATSLELDSAKQEIFNHKLQKKYKQADALISLILGISIYILAESRT